MDRREFLNGSVAATVVGFLSRHVADPTAPPVPAESDSARPGLAYMRRQGNRLVNGSGQAVRFAGANLYWLGLDDNLGPTPAYPSQQSIRQGLSSAAALGCNVVRAHTLGISVGNPLSIAPEYGEWNSDAFASIDYAVATARELGLRLIVPLIDEWRYYHGGKWVFVQWAYQQGVAGISEPLADLTQTAGNNPQEKVTEAAFYSDPTIIAFYEQYIDYLLSHVNSFTGVALKADPTILAWETGNELWDATPAWTAEISSYLKSLAPNTLVADGSAATGLAVADAPGLNVASVDIVGSHYYPPDISQLAADAAAAASAGKIMVVGEWPSTTPGVAISDWTAAIEQNPAITGDAVWSVLPWNPDGTPEPHDDGYTLHVPGATPAEIAIDSAVFAHSSVQHWG